MGSVRSICLGMLAASVALVGVGQADEPAAAQVDIGALWGAMDYCSEKGTSDPKQRAEYQQLGQNLRRKLRELPRGSKQQAFVSKKSVHRAGVYQGRTLDSQECMKLRSAAELAAQETEAEGDAKKSDTAKQAGGAS